MCTRTVIGGALTLVAGVLLAVSACNGGRATGGASADTLAPGTWGGENAGAIVSDTIAHVHIGCTLGTSGCLWHWTRRAGPTWQGVTHCAPSR